MITETTPPQGPPTTPEETKKPKDKDDDIEMLEEVVPLGNPVLPKTAGFPLEILAGVGVAIMGIGSAMKINKKK